jgi:hypothetical protein
MFLLAMVVVVIVVVAMCESFAEFCVIRKHMPIESYVHFISNQVDVSLFRLSLTSRTIFFHSTRRPSR